MRLTVCVYDTEAEPNLIRSDVLDPSWLEIIRQRDVWDIRSTSATRLKVSLTITVHLRIREASTRLSIGILNKLVNTVLLRTTHVDRLIKLIHPAKRKSSLITPRRCQYFWYTRLRVKITCTSQITGKKLQKIWHCCWRARNVFQSTSRLPDWLFFIRRVRDQFQAPHKQQAW